jgi:hypothetical protein
MDLPGERKKDIFKLVISELARHFTLVSLNTHADRLRQRSGLRVRKAV